MKMRQLLFIICILGFFKMNAQETTEAVADTAASGVNLQKLFNTSELSTDSGRLLTVDGLGLFYFDQGTLVSLDSISCPDIRVCRLKYNVSYDDLVMCDGYFIIKSGRYIMMLDGDNTRILSKFDTSLFFLYPGGDDYINVVIPEENGEWAWYMFKIYSQKLECVTRMTSPITKVIDHRTNAFMVSGNTIYLASGEGMEPLMNSNFEIEDVASTSLGFFVVSGGSLFLVTFYDEESTPIIENEVYGLYSDGDVLYIVMENGDVLRLSL